MPRVFISHSSADRDLVECEIIVPLHLHGIETWYCRDSIPSTAQWERAIVQGLKDCDWFLVVMSPNSADSRWVKAEVDWAMQHRWKPLRLVPVILADCDPIDFHLCMPQLQHIDFRHDRQEAVRELMALWPRRVAPRLEPEPPVSAARNSRLYLEVEQIADIAVVTFLGNHIRSGEQVESIGRQLLSLVEDQGRRKLLLNCHKLDRMPGDLLQVLERVGQKLQMASGRLVLCCLAPDILEMLKEVKRTRFFDVLEDEKTALQSF